MRFNELVVLDRELPRLPEVASGSLEEHVVCLLVVACSNGARHDCALGVSLRDGLARNLEFDLLNGGSLGSTRRAHVAARLRRQPRRKRLLRLIVSFVSALLCFVVELLEVGPAIEVLLELIVCGLVVENLDILRHDRNRSFSLAWHRLFPFAMVMSPPICATVSERHAGAVGARAVLDGQRVRRTDRTRIDASQHQKMPQQKTRTVPLGAPGLLRLLETTKLVFGCQESLRPRDSVQSSGGGGI